MEVKHNMFEQTFKNIDDILHKDAGCSSELDYTEQTSWMLFLKYLDDLEHEKSLNAELMEQEYQYIIDSKHRWSAWAAPKDKNGNFGHNNALTGDDLMDYVDGELFPYLKGFKQRAESAGRAEGIEYKIGETIYDGAADSDPVSAIFDKSWSISVDDIDQATWDLSVKNPNAEEAPLLREPTVIIEEIIALDKECEGILNNIKELI